MEHDTTNLQEQVASLRNELQSMASQKSNMELLLQASQEKEKSLQEQLEVDRKDQQGQQSTLHRQLHESRVLAAGLRAESSGRLEELETATRIEGGGKATHNSSLRAEVDPRHRELVQG
jgi:predicted  nucleic acid-binding Zn-ribbon protein